MEHYKWNPEPICYGGGEVLDGFSPAALAWVHFQIMVVYPNNVEVRNPFFTVGAFTNLDQIEIESA
ncbi:hypothetical protein N7450_011679 [Penicillium hetheringtonii]|uniref:Uncharacterized protein n=1 Tax=Penicillium hetheringtonii TaxID=911720 RepID=A0AAD6GM36_9EURO|nr:hypothetical protein N7450_011679 [Penicillium hetheringtonii]